MKKGLAFLLAFAMMFSMCQIPVFAENEIPAPASEETAAAGHLSAEATTDSVQVGDDITIKLSLSQMNVISFMGGLHYDPEYVEFVSVSPGSCILTGTNDETSEPAFSVLNIARGGDNRDVGMYFVGTGNVTYDKADAFTTVTFKALKAGTAEFDLYENADGNDIFESNAYGSFSVEITAGAEVSDTAFSLVTAEGEKIAVSADEMKAATSVTTTADAPWTYNTTNEAVGTFYSLKSILENKGVDASEAHGLKVIAKDGFTSGFAVEDIEDLYIYDMPEVTINGEAAGAAGTYGTALNGGAGNKWAKDIATAAIVTDHVWFTKGGACRHFCAICGEGENVIAEDPVIQWNTSVTPYTATVNAAYACGAPVEVKVEVTSEKAPTCTEDGEIEYTASCTINGTVYTDKKTATVAKTGHDYKTTITKATLTRDGKIVKTCTHDGCTYSRISTSRIKTITSNSTTSFKDTNATANGSKYQYKIIAYKTVSGITYKSTESAVKTIYRLTRPSISGLSNSASKKMTVSWSRNTKANGYQIQYCTSSSFSSGTRTVNINSNSTVKKTIDSLTKGKTYYVRIRAYKTVSGTKYYSSWSLKKSVKISR